MGNLVPSFEDHGDHLRVVAVVFPRRNGLPNFACVQHAMKLLEGVNPEAFDPVEGVPEAMAQAARRDRRFLPVMNLPPLPGIEPTIVMTADDPPLPDFGIPVMDAGLLPDDDEIIFPRACPVGGCGED